MTTSRVPSTLVDNELADNRFDTVSWYRLEDLEPQSSRDSARVIPGCGVHADVSAWPVTFLAADGTVDAGGPHASCHRRDVPSRHGDTGSRGRGSALRQSTDSSGVGLHSWCGVAAIRNGDHQQ